MTIKEWHYDFMLKLDKVASNQKKNFNVAERDWFLNEAQDLFKKQRLFANNSKQTGFEEGQKRIDDLSTIHIKYPDQLPVTLIKHPDMDGIKVYELPLNTLKYNYDYFIKGHLDLKANNCINRAKLYAIQNEDFEDAISSPYQLSEERVLINFGKSSTLDGVSSIYIYSLYPIENDKIYIEYIKQHRKINYGGYVYIDGITYPETNSEFPEHTHKEIVDIAVQLAAGIIEASNYSLQTNKLSINE